MSVGTQHQNATYSMKVIEGRWWYEYQRPSIRDEYERHGISVIRALALGILIAMFMFGWLDIPPIVGWVIARVGDIIN